MNGWHLDEATVTRYAHGRVTMAVAASVEAHLLACAPCRALLTPAVDLARLRSLWDDVAERVDTPAPGLVERLLRLARIPEDTSRLLASTPSLRASWLLALGAVLGFAALASEADERGTLLFLTLAPILPVVGVATAFHRRLDPAHEIGLAAPYPAFRLLLLRSAAVVGVTSLAAAGASLLLAGPALAAAAWLLPALALTSLTLALSRRFDIVHVACGVGAGWVAAVAGAQIEGGRFAAFGTAGQLACLLVTVASLLALVAYRDRYATPLGGA